MTNKNFNKAYISTILFINQKDCQNRIIADRNEIFSSFFLGTFKIKHSTDKISVLVSNRKSDNFSIKIKFASTNSLKYANKEELTSLKKYHEFYKKHTTPNYDE